MNLQFRAQPEIPAKYIHRIQWSVSVVSTQGISSLPVIALKPLLQLFKPVTLWLSIKMGESHGAISFFQVSATLQNLPVSCDSPVPSDNYFSLFFTEFMLLFSGGSFIQELPSQDPSDKLAGLLETEICRYSRAQTSWEVFFLLFRNKY